MFSYKRKRLSTLYYITKDWSEQPWFSTGGTRAKKYLQGPDGKFYYFKRSQYKEATELKPGKDYKYEFWSEIIAYELGTSLGFNMLRYDIAVDGEIMGCISESMINSENQELVEGVKYLQAFSPKYEPANKEHQNWYTFDLIERALKSANLEENLNNILEIIVFDSLIGNGDRHQENWAVITKQKLITDVIEEIEQSKEVKVGKILKWLFKIIREAVNSKRKKDSSAPLPKSYYVIDKSFAPIYDSGSSLGRELVDEKVDLILTSEELLLQYISRGTSEIHWDSKKPTHFELIRNLLKSRYGKEMIAIIERVIKSFDVARLEEIVKTIDKDVPESHKRYKIPDNRKLLIIKMINLRFEKLRELIHERV